jgi:hypothetical protein
VKKEKKRKEGKGGEEGGKGSVGRTEGEKTVKTRGNPNVAERVVQACLHYTIITFLFLIYFYLLFICSL